MRPRLPIAAVALVALVAPPTMPLSAQDAKGVIAAATAACHGDADLSQAGHYVAGRAETRHAGPLVVVDDQHAVFIVFGAEPSRQL